MIDAEAIRELLRCLAYAAAGFLLGVFGAIGCRRWTR